MTKEDEKDEILKVLEPKKKSKVNENDINLYVADLIQTHFTS